MTKPDITVPATEIEIADSIYLINMLITSLGDSNKNLTSIINTIRKLAFERDNLKEKVKRLNSKLESYNETIN